MTETVILPQLPEPDPPDADPAIAAWTEFDRFADLENEAISRIAVSVVFDAIEKTAWIEA